MRRLGSVNPAKITRRYGALVRWELRRALFNVALVLSGGVYLVVINLITGRYIESGRDANEPVLMWLVGACLIIAANACFTLGGVVESIWREGDTSRIRTSVYRRGRMLSLAVAVMPGVVALMAGVLFTIR